MALSQRGTDHPPCRDELQSAAVVAGARAECLWQGLLRVKVEQIQFTAEDI